MHRALVWFALATSLTVSACAAENPAPATRPATPRVGEQAADFTLKTPAGESVSLSGLRKNGPVVLIVLRGWPGYQCPICTKQVAEFVPRAKDFEVAGAQLLLVYPGPSEDLSKHAEDFARGKGLPERFSFVVDPDYTFTRAYGLRWDAKGETAYPSSFVIDQTGKVTFAKVSNTHGGRASADEVLAALHAMKKNQ
jgi:peroxiredoxin